MTAAAPAVVSHRDVIVRTPAFLAAQRYYEDVLGLTRVHASEGLVGYETGAFRLYVERGPAHGPVFELLVPDVAAARARFLAAGCVLVEEVAGERCYLQDPCGLTFNLRAGGG